MSLHHAYFSDVGDFGLDGARILVDERGEPAVGLGREHLHLAAGAHHDHVEIVHLDEFRDAFARALPDCDHGGQHRDAGGDAEHHQERALLV